MSLAVFMLIGIVTGMAFGLIGDAATAAVVPLLLISKAVPSIKYAIGTSMGMLLPPIGLIAAYEYYKEGYVNIKGSLAMAAAFMASSLITSRMVKKIKEETIKKLVAIFLIIIGIGIYIT